MVRTFDFNLVKDVIENARQSNNFHVFDHFEHILSEILRNMRIVLSNSIIPNLSDYILLKRVRKLYFLIISRQN